jgi:FtsP/CotA-like multicopper oxidase with cupredoxin domain
MKGPSTANVPDMWFDPLSHALVPAGTAGSVNDPGPGAMTFFWTNQQGGRLMFFHDHAYGITRLNVYAGEAAGYLLADPREEDKLSAATVPGTIGALVGGTTANDLNHLIPLVIQDKTFVPSAPQLNFQDPTWAANFGRTPGTPDTGDLWFPHVYTTNQDPADPGGANGFGRWDYGAWFFPPMTSLTAAKPPSQVTISCTSNAFPSQTLGPNASCPNCGCPITPNPSGTPESFMDTPVVNGRAYPVLHVAPEAYRFQILSAGNDRSWNLSWFLADPTQSNTEVAMLPAVPPASGTALPLCSAINPVAIPSLDMGLATGLLDGTGNPLNGTGLQAGCWPNYGPQAGIPKAQTMWAADGRAGGAPDPTKAGPAWIQIGSEGGLLPAPVVIPPTPVNYELNTRSVTVTNVAVHGLWLGPAERADVVVDFSKYSNQTLILYNDAPTPAPGFDSRLDYFTGDGDQSSIGGAPNTQPGYGPNTRTVMQVVVDLPPSGAPAFSLPTLKAAFASTSTTPGLFASTQPTTIVPEAGYNSAYNGSFPNSYANIAANALTFTPISPLNFEALVPPPGSATCSAAAPAQCANFDQKTIQELFTLDYGRMNATLGTELPLTSFQNQTTIPLGYVDPPTEIVRQGDTQLWKITHNGVDTHFIHFHLFNVQVINRMGWDGTVRPPDANELGWKDTVRMNPLEDILVALQPITPQLPWPIPNSVRLEDTTQAAGTTTATGGMFSDIDPFTGAGVTTVNELTNFGWEYVWHCHILGHEENDMMRPIVFQVPPPAPSNLTAVQSTVPPMSVTLTWTDNSANETGFTIQRDTDPSFTSPNLFILPPVGPSPATPGFPINAAGEGTSWGGTITTVDSNVVSGTVYYYRVQAIDDGFKAPPSGLSQSYNANPPTFSAWSNTVSLSTVPIAPTVTFTGAPATAAYNTSFTVTATTNASTIPTIVPTGVCTVGPVTGTPANAIATITMTSGTGSCQLAANWAADVFFTTASATQSTTATLATPAVSFTGAPASAAYQSAFTVTATTNAGVAPAITGNSVCSAGAVSGTSSATSLITMSSGTGTCTVTANWAATTNYATASLSQSTSAALATPTITWANPSSITYGTALSSTQLNASATFNGNPVAGTFVYTPAAGTILSAGTQTLSTSFTPAAPNNFASASATATLVVSRAASAVTIGTSSPNPSVVGQPVSTGFTVGGVSGAANPTGTVTVAATTGESCTATLPATSCSITFVTTGTRAMTASYSGDSNYLSSASGQSFPAQNVIDFVLGINPGTQSVNGGQKALYTVTATAIGGVAMPISLTCGLNQSHYSCTVAPTSITPNGGSKNATTTVLTMKGFPGTWTLTVKGVYGSGVPATGGLTHTVNAQLTVKN